MDIFRVFDSLNYIPNCEVGINAIHAAGGVVEAVVCYTGDVLNPKCEYNIEYYLSKVRELVALKAHILCIKDMAGLLKPRAASALVGAIRAEFPDLPIHVHSHDTAGTGVASMIAAIEAGADIVDCATDAMSGLTSQPSIGAVVNALRGGPHASELDPDEVRPSRCCPTLSRSLFLYLDVALAPLGTPCFSSSC
jgi:pyruvate carboxylase